MRNSRTDQILMIMSLKVYSSQSERLIKVLFEGTSIADGPVGLAETAYHRPQVSTNCDGEQYEASH